MKKIFLLLILLVSISYSYRLSFSAGLLDTTISYFNYDYTKQKLVSTGVIELPGFDVAGTSIYNIVDGLEWSFPLEGGTYRIWNDVTIDSLEIVPGDTVILIGVSPDVNLNITSTGNAIIGRADAGTARLSIYNLNINTLGASATVFDLNGVLFSSVDVKYTAGNTGQTLGTIYNSPFSVTIERGVFVNYSGGIRVDSVATRLLIDKCNFIATAITIDKAIQVGDSIPRVELTGIEFFQGPTDTLFQLDSNINTSVQIDGITNNGGSVFFTDSSLTQKSPYINVMNSNPEMSSSISIEIVAININTSVDIPAVDAMVLPKFNTFTTNYVNRFIVDTNGFAEYIGISPVDVSIDIEFTAEPAQSTKDMLSRAVKIQSLKDTVTFTNATNVINDVGTIRSNGDNITFYNTSGTLPSGLRKDIIYYVVNKTTDSFQVSYTSGGSAVTFSTNGSGELYYKNVAISGSYSVLPVTNNTPRPIHPKGVINVSNGDILHHFVANTDDAADIDINHTYSRFAK